MEKGQCTRIERIGKKGGAFSSPVPKYFCARGPSYLPYFALASSVHGGLLPICRLSVDCIWIEGSPGFTIRTAPYIDTAQEDGMETVRIYISIHSPVARNQLHGRCWSVRSRVLAQHSALPIQLQQRKAAPEMIGPTRPRLHAQPAIACSSTAMSMRNMSTANLLRM